jgi:hypothetical protein
VEQISTSDLLSLLLTQRASIDLQFQFWLSITFAVIVAGFVAGRRLELKLRLLTAGLYLLATAHLGTRWIYDGGVGERWVAVLVSRGVDIGIPWVSVYLRMSVMLLGTASALVFLLRHDRAAPGDGIPHSADRQGGHCLNS